MKSFYVVANSTKDGLLHLAKDISSFLISEGAECTVDECRLGHPDKDILPENTDCIIVLGGDGTILQAVRSLNEPDIPIMGINAGNMGFLASVEQKDIKEALMRLIADDFIIEDRMMIEGKVSNESCGTSCALNEIVVTGTEPMQFISISISVNDQFLTKVSGDGMLIATPTGSTGYNMSAGGPIINPTSQIMILTPICVHSMLNKSIAFSADDTITITVDEGRHGEIQKVEAVFDGATKMTLVSGDSITVNKSEKVTRIVKLTEESFLETLQNKFRGE